MPKEQHIHVHIEQDHSVAIQITQINNKLDRFIMKQDELAQKLDALTAQSQKSNAEINTKLGELQVAIEAQGNVSPEVQTALAGLQAAVQANDDLIPDAPPAEESQA